MRIAKITHVFQYFGFMAILSVLFYSLFTKSIDFHVDSNINFYALVIGLCLVVVNYGIESLKFHQVLNTELKISYAESYKMVLLGIATSFLTPNRAFSFVGRVLKIKGKNQKVKIALKNSITTISQSTITVFFGLLFGTHFIKQLTSENPKLIFLAVLFPITFFIVGLIFRKKIKRLFQGFKIKDFSSQFGLSLLRFLIFILQYWMLFLAFNQDISFLEVLEKTSVVFFILFLIPFGFFGSIGSRELAMLNVFSSIAPNVIIQISLSIWLINVIIPALIGPTFLISKK